MHFKPLFWVETEGYRFLMGPLGVLVCVPIAVFVVLVLRRSFPDDERVATGQIFAFAALGLIAFLTPFHIKALLREHAQLRGAIEKGAFAVAEGPIRQLTVVRRKGSHHLDVTFEVANARFRLSDFSGDNLVLNYSGFRKTGLAEGHYVRIGHRLGSIIRLEVRQP